MSDFIVKYYYERSDGTIKEILKNKRSDYAEFIKFIDYCRENDVCFWLRDDYECSDEVSDMMMCGASVDRFHVAIADDTMFPFIEVILK